MVASLMWSTPISCGNSTFITVSVRMPKNASEPTATIAQMSLPGMRSSRADYIAASAAEIVPEVWG